RTMVFTHLPPNLSLIAIPFTSSLPGVIALLLVRSLLPQMDVPTRNSYVMAVVTPGGRPPPPTLTPGPPTRASGIGPLISGGLVMLSGFAWPVLLAGLFKSAYDLALLAMFSHVRPPEERTGSVEISASPQR